jgi:peptide/nickel transport system ATP-binding protein
VTTDTPASGSQPRKDDPHSTSAVALSVKGLVTTFPGESGLVSVVDDVSFDIKEREVVALVGESGCGKSMTALSIMRLVPRPGRIRAQSIHLGKTEILSLSVPEMRTIRGAGISMIFQEPMTSLNPVLTCGDQVVEGIRLHEKVTYRAARDRAVRLFEDVGIPDASARFDAYPHQLSGGLKQRVMIAMALSTRPRLLIADEPTTALDVTIQAQILHLMRRLRDDYGTSVLLITHDLGVVNELADRVVVMYAGKIAEQGNRHDVLKNAQHPYTLGLLASMPARARPGERLHEIKGVVPPPWDWPVGCHFCTRCERKFEPCETVQPGPTRITDSHRVFCHDVERQRQ